MPPRRLRPSPSAIVRFVREYPWIHTALGLVGNTTFLVGSILFFWESTQTAGTWLFVAGATGMLLGSLGSALVTYEERSPRSSWQTTSTATD